MKQTSNFKLVSFFLLALALSPVFGARPKDLEEIKKTEEKLEKAQERIDAALTEEKKLIKLIYKQAKVINDTINKVERSEISLGGLSGLGNVEQMRIKAERYVVEKQSRQKLQEDFREMYKTLQTWQKLKAQIEEEREFVKLRQLLKRLEEQRAAADPMSTLKPENFSWYTLDRAATLEDIAINVKLADNNPTAWRDIYDANLDLIKKLGYISPSPDIEIPKGEDLKIPNLPEEFIGVGTSTPLPAKTKPAPKGSAQPPTQAPAPPSKAPSAESQSQNPKENNKK